ncbi:aldehyde dehydrogenase family protein [Sphingomonadaceae bacterium jetA1]|jgi:succinate-semialdehyde dehydrogenase/glutarate-semialdehyde dehydrogenase|uniref:aldehyde dehydrogenase family protein n=1 Tax=Facivitalis istanbulensis TaxID=3075838 RepID=UPI0034761214
MTEYLATGASPSTSGASPNSYRTVNPATGELVKVFATLSDEEADALLARADAAFSSWRSQPVARRVELFRTLADRLDANLDRIARQITIDMGKPLVQSKFEAQLGPAILRYYADHAEKLLADTEVALAGFSRVYTRREPIGVVLAVEPWNGPVYQAVRAIAPNLMVGNCVILKPAEIVAGTTLILDELFAEAGFPASVYQTALASREQISVFIADPRVRAVTLTGSDRAGVVIGEQAGRSIKPVVLELGGSDAFIVLDSADVAAAAGMGAVCRLALGGQVCVSPKRVIVTEKVADDFIRQYTEVFASQTIGDPLNPDTTLGPLSSIAAADGLQAQYQDAIDKGATVVLRGGRIEGDGAFFKPAVLTGITPDMRLYHEEAFGPIGLIFRVSDADAAIALANDTKYGLGGTVYGQDLDEARRVAQALDTGMVGINQYLGAPIEIPFGGTKASGVGRELGLSGMDAFSNVKTYAVA